MAKNEITKPEYDFGRPAKYKKQYAKDLFDFMSEGYPFDAFGGYLYRKYPNARPRVTVAVGTTYRWLDKHKPFREAKLQAETSGYQWWLNTGRRGMSGQMKRVKKETYDINPKTGERTLLTQELEPATFSAHMWSIFMRNLYKKKGWSDTRDHRLLNQENGDGDAEPLVIMFSRDKGKPK